MLLFPTEGACGRAVRKPGYPCCGENAPAQHRRGAHAAQFAHCAQQSRRWKGIVRHAVSDLGGTAGAGRPFGEVAPGDFPCRKAEATGRAAEAFTEGIRTIVAALQVSVPRRGPELRRQLSPFRGMLFPSPHVNLTYNLKRL